MVKGILRAGEGSSVVHVNAATIDNRPVPWMLGAFRVDTIKNLVFTILNFQIRRCIITLLVCVEFVQFLPWCQFTT